MPVDDKPSENSDDSDLASLRGTTYKIYRYVFKAGRTVKVNDMSRDLNLSSPSIAYYHLNKLIRMGLVREELEGYTINRVVFENVIRFRRRLIPLQAAYAAFFAGSLLVLLTFLRPSVVTAEYFFAVLVVGISMSISIFEALKALRRL